ncbi:hypothetical protein DFJ73DRAFT_821542 [Zopfochytrium polystomum]|nr:hypothetical protein DFJ73DRAFT_821542 [Zopfochytrium polystomum]
MSSTRILPNFSPKWFVATFMTYFILRKKVKPWWTQAKSPCYVLFGILLLVSFFHYSLLPFSKTIARRPPPPSQPPLIPPPAVEVVQEVPPPAVGEGKTDPDHANVDDLDAPGSISPEGRVEDSALNNNGRLSNMQKKSPTSPQSGTPNFRARLLEAANAAGHAVGTAANAAGHAVGSAANVAGHAVGDAALAFKKALFPGRGSFGGSGLTDASVDNGRAGVGSLSGKRKRRRRVTTA